MQVVWISKGLRAARYHQIKLPPSVTCGVTCNGNPTPVPTPLKIVIPGEMAQNQQLLPPQLDSPLKANSPLNFNQLPTSQTSPPETPITSSITTRPRKLRSNSIEPLALESATDTPKANRASKRSANKEASDTTKAKSAKESSREVKATSSRSKSKKRDILAVRVLPQPQSFHSPFL